MASTKKSHIQNITLFHQLHHLWKNSKDLEYSNSFKAKMQLKTANASSVQLKIQFIKLNPISQFFILSLFMISLLK
jgi:hypothetical protein